MPRFLNAFLLTAALAIPFAASAQTVRVQRYYDRDHKDYHEWNDSENQRYRQFLTEKKIKEHQFARSRKAEQRDYWRWRHDHAEWR